MLRTVARRLLGPYRLAAVRRLPIVRPVLEVIEWLTWRSNGFAAPPPPSVKRRALRRNAIVGGTFVETGTFLGDTSVEATAYSHRVITIEASPTLCAYLRRRFVNYPQIELVEGTSQEYLLGAVSSVRGDVTFWLDAHASGGITFGDPEITSIRRDLATIAASRHQFGSIVVMVDDIRGFGHQPPHYPDVSFLIDWADQNEMTWNIELDMMCMRSRGVAS